MNKASNSKTEKVATPTSKIRLRVHSQTSATIFRNDGLPFIDDKTENAVNWLVSNGYKEEEIEIIGEKPSTWNTAYPKVIPEVIEPVAAEPEFESEPIAELTIDVEKVVESEPIAELIIELKKDEPESVKTEPTEVK